MSVTQQLEAAGGGTGPRARRAPGPSAILQFQLTKKKVPRKDLMHFSRQLAVFIKAGIPILDALDAIHQEMGKTFFRSVLEDVMVSLRGGATFADAVSGHSEAFPPYYLGILRSAELTGQLDKVLLQLSDYIERDLEARRKITSALTYPAVILALGVIVVIILVTLVLPKFETFFADLGAELPLPTRILLSTSSFVTSQFLWIALGGLIIVVGTGATLRTASGAAAKDRLLLRLPVVGDLVRHVVLERFCRILSSMMAAGVPLPEAMAVTSEATSNAVYRRGLVRVRSAMLKGEGLAAPLIDSGLFPPSARQMFRVGENTGTLDQQLETAAGYFERELDYKIKRFTNLFEPAVIIGMGLIVGFVAVALVSAMYGIFSSSRTV